jgi:phosphate uptake regulator
MEASTQQHLSMLKILYAACSTAVDAFRAADNPVDRELIADLEKMVERTHREIERLAADMNSS